MITTLPAAFPRLNNDALAAGEAFLKTFLTEQLENFGGEMEIADGCWALLATPVTASDEEHIAKALLSNAPFAFLEGESEDSAWTIFYVAESVRADARHWLTSIQHMLEGAIVAPSPSDREKLMELLVVKMPHRAARTLVAAREQGTLPVAALRDRRDVRALLDQVHLQDPMFLGAFAELLKNHLIDLAVLFAEINADDLNVLNELTKGTASSDPFFMGRHSAGSAIRQQLIDDKILNPLDQHKHSDVKNPYTTLMRLRFNQGELLMRIDGIEQTTSVTAFRETLIKIRRRLYRGIDVLDMDSRVPWAVDDVAYHLRFVRQQITDNPGRDVLEVLYMLERAVS